MNTRNLDYHPYGTKASTLARLRRQIAELRRIPSEIRERGALEELEEELEYSERLIEA